MARGRLQAVKNVEGDLLKIAGVAVLGTVGIYALIKSAPAIGDLFNKGISNIVSGIVSGLPSFGGSSTTPDQSGSTVQPATGGQSLPQFLAQYPNAESTGLPIQGHGYTNQSGSLMTISNQDLLNAEKILRGDIPSPNVGGGQNPGIKEAISDLIAGLGQSDLEKLYPNYGQSLVGTFQINGKGAVLPLTQNAVDYYNQHHISLTEITKF